MALAYLARRAEAVREAERGIAMVPLFPYAGYLHQQLVRIHILTGNHEKALDVLEPLLRAYGGITPGWLRIDPNFDPLRGNPRFENLARGT